MQQQQQQYSGPERRQSQSQDYGAERRRVHMIDQPLDEASSLPGLSSQERGPGHDERIRQQQVNTDTH